MSILSSLHSYKDVSILCNIIRGDYNESELNMHLHHAPILQTTQNSTNISTSTAHYEDESLSFNNSTDDDYTAINNHIVLLYKLYLNNMDIMPAINNFICDGYGSSYSALSEQRNNSLLKYYVIKYIYPIIFIFGLFGNIVSLLTMIRIYQRKHIHKTFTISLAALALADLFVLIFGCAREWLENTFNVEIKTLNNQFCKSILFICYVSSSYSAWIHVFIAMERWIAINIPFKINIICTIKTNRFMNILMLLLCLIINCPLLWFAELDEKLMFNINSYLGISVTKICEVRHDNLMVNAFVVFTDSVFFCILPFLLVFVLSTTTICKLIRSNGLMQQGSVSSPLHMHRISDDILSKSRLDKRKNDEYNNDQGGIANKAGTVWRFKNNNNNSLDTPPDVANIAKSKDNISLNSFNYSRGTLVKTTNKPPSNVKSTFMLLSLPVCYMITVLPIITLIIIGWSRRHTDASSNKQDDTNKAEATMHYFEIAHCIASVLMYVNSSINILLYILFGKSLRKDFLLLVPCSHKAKLVKFFSTTKKPSARAALSIKRKKLQRQNNVDQKLVLDENVKIVRENSIRRLDDSMVNIDFV